MRIYITAISGFLGAALAEHLQARGHRVSGSTRRIMELGRPFDSTVFEGQDCVIHCAHDFGPGSAALNFEGTKAWMETAAAVGVKQQVFVSSHAARPDADSEYGLVKHQIESLFLKRGYTVLRPGLVTGPGGLYQRQKKALSRSAVIPMIGGGAQPVATISLEDFLRAAAAVIESKHAGAWNLFYEPMPTYREFVTKMCEGREVKFLSIPFGLALGLAQVAALLRLPVPVKPGQIRALEANRTSPWKSDLTRLLGQQ